MEISQDEQIFKILKLMEDLIKTNKTNEFIIKIYNDNGSWTETEFNNFINTFRSNYTEVNKDEYLEVIDENNITLIISKLKNILLYCNSNNYKSTEYIWNKPSIISDEKINDLFDINMDMQIINNDNLITEPEKWDMDLKRFRLIKEFNYNIEDGITAVGKIVKDSNDRYLTMKK